MFTLDVDAVVADFAVVVLDLYDEERDVVLGFDVVVLTVTAPLGL